MGRVRRRGPAARRRERKAFTACAGRESWMWHEQYNLDVQCSMCDATCAVFNVRCARFAAPGCSRAGGIAGTRRAFSTGDDETTCANDDGGRESRDLTTRWRLRDATRNVLPPAAGTAWEGERPCQLGRDGHDCAGPKSGADANACRRGFIYLV